MGAGPCASRNLGAQAYACGLDDEAILAAAIPEARRGTGGSCATA